MPPPPRAGGALVPFDPDIAERLEHHARVSRGALASNTERALKADVAVFTAWCADRGRAALPATSDTVAAFVDAMAIEKKPATVRRYVSSVSTFHKAAGLASPTATLEVRMALKRMNRERGTRQDQAAPLTRGVLDRLLAAGIPGDRLIDRRDRALLAVAYDTLVRRSELVALAVEDLAVAEDGTGTVLVRKSKTDQAGEGSVRFLAADTVPLVRAWLAAAGIGAGPIFRPVSKGGAVGAAALAAGKVARIVKERAQRAGVDPAGLSGHSTRVGAAQDMIGAGLEIGEVMQAGGWKSPAMVARYSERLLARRGAAAKLAARQGRG